MGWAEKLPSGRYRAMYRDVSGRQRSAGTFTHKREAENQAAATERDARRLGWRDPDAARRLWSEWADEWWASRSVEPGTAIRDSQRLERHLRPRWGHVAVGAITRHEVKAWAAELTRTPAHTVSAAPLAPATVRRIVYMLSASLEAAVDAEIIATNPAARIKIASGQTDVQRFLTLEEFGAIVDEIPSHFDVAIASLLVGTGARWGEAIGVHIPRLSVARAELRIAETWDDEMRRVKPYPKGRKIRDVPVPVWVLDQLTPLIDGRRNGLLWERNGAMPIISNWRKRVWEKAVDRAGLGHVRIHDLRHTYASWLLQRGISLAEVGRLMGHVSPLTTQQYAHLAEVPRAHILRALPDPIRGANVGQPDVLSPPSEASPIPLRRADSAQSS